MSEQIFIPYIDPINEIIESYPYKIIFNDRYLEIFSRFTIKEPDPDTGIPTIVSVDLQEAISKEAVSGIEGGKSVKYEDHYLVNIYYLDRRIGYFFASKKEQKEFYSKVVNWRFQ